MSTDADCPLSSPDLQPLSSGSQFSHDQLSQLRKIIAEVIGPQWTDSDQALGLPTDVPPLSPASGINSVLNNTSGQISQSLPHVIQDGGRSQHQLVPSLPLAPQGSAPLLHLGAQNDLNLPPLPEKLFSKIAKHEYIDFNDLLSDNMYPHPSFASSKNNFTLTVDSQDVTTLDFVPSQQKRRCIDGLSSWLETWNVFLRSTSPYIRNFPQTSSHTRTKYANLAESSRHQPGLCMIQPSGTWLPPIPPWPGLK